MLTHQPLAVNIIGHFAGAVIFAIFLFLLLRDRASVRSRGRWLSITSAMLAFLWNAGSLTVLLLPGRATTEANIVSGFSFAVLSLLPAVLLHVSLQDGSRPVVLTGYLLSSLAVGMHLGEALRPDLDLHRTALLLVTAGFGVLTIASVARTVLHGGEHTAGWPSRIVASMCLLLFAISFAHLGSGHPPKPWSTELILHHAGIPLALFILLQDYRFVLLDAFLRFLTNVMLAALLAFGALQIALRLTSQQERRSPDPAGEAIAISSICLLLILFAFLREYVQRWLTRVVFRRGDLDALIRRMRKESASMSTEAQFLPWAAKQVAQFVEVSRFELVDLRSDDAAQDLWLHHPTVAADVASLRANPQWDWVEAAIPLHASQKDTHYILLGRRHGGRRYLSEDLQSLSRLAAFMLEELDRFRTSEMQRLVSQAELKALQSQINPHFLFNALNTLYGIIPREAPGARRTVLNLAEIFRYFLRSEKMFIPLSEELKIITAYLEIESLRLGPRLQTEVDIDQAALTVQIPILSIQPLVENAIKHGLAARLEQGLLRVSAKMVDGELVIAVEDSGSGVGKTPAEKTQPGAGVGLANVSRRLQLCYGPQAGVLMESSPLGTKVHFRVPQSRLAAT